MADTTRRQNYKPSPEKFYCVNCMHPFAEGVLQCPVPDGRVCWLMCGIDITRDYNEIRKFRRIRKFAKKRESFK